MMLHNLSLQFKKSGKLFLLIAAIISLAGLLMDDDKVKIAQTAIFFEYIMMTLIIFVILFVSTFLFKRVYSVFINM